MAISGVWGQMAISRDLGLGQGAGLAERVGRMRGAREGLRASERETERAERGAPQLRVTNFVQ
jgi:hypothetical protein